MRLRTRLLLMVAGIVAVTVALATWIISNSTRHAFEAQETERANALLAQFRQEFSRRGDDVVRRVEGIAGSESILRIAIETGRPAPDYALYVNEAISLAQGHGLDFLEVIAWDGTIISSAQWPARFGYKSDLIATAEEQGKGEPFLKHEELPSGKALALSAVRIAGVSDRRVYVAGGVRLDQQFLKSLVLPKGMSVLLYQHLNAAFSPELLLDAGGVASGSKDLEPLLTEVLRDGRELTRVLNTAAGPEAVHVLPLIGRDKRLLGVLLVESSLRDLQALLARIRWSGITLGGTGILIGVALSYIVAARITRPIEKLAAGAQAVARGDWDATVQIDAGGEVGLLAQSFNRMTRQLIDQRDRLIQAERVAAWRELARRLAHELKNPLFPLQITVDNLQRAKDQERHDFDDVFHESTSMMLTELEKLKGIIARFSGFAKMPQPQVETIRINDLLTDTLKLFEAQFRAPDRPSIATEMRLDSNLNTIRADPELLGRVFQNLFLNAVDAMPGGGTLGVRTFGQDKSVLVEISDTGVGLTEEERGRLFTPYYTTKQHGTGLGLAIVQAVVSDHAGKIWVDSRQGVGTTFHIELPRG